MKIIVNHNSLKEYGCSTYKGFYDIFERIAHPTHTLNYNANNLSEYLWQNKYIDFEFEFIGIDFNKVLTCQNYNDKEWNAIISVINEFVVTFPNNRLTYCKCVGEFAMLVEIDKNKYETYGYYTYKGFYEDIYAILNGKNIPDFADYENCNYNADLLNEFLWYNHCKNIKFVFKNFDIESIKTKKTYDNYEWGLIFDVLNRFVKDYPNNTLEINNR